MENPENAESPVNFDEMNIAQRHELKVKAAKLFSPRTPIDTQRLFAGRWAQITKINNTIQQSGAHAIIYGERGVGKTSLANIAPMLFSVLSNVEVGLIVAPARINCDGTDSYDALWRKVFSAIKVTEEKSPIGFLQTSQTESTDLLEHIKGEGEFTPGSVVSTLQEISNNRHVIITLDEFDRLNSSEVPKLISDTIKSLSDHNVSVTLQIVGVGDSVAAIVAGHESVGRHLVEIPLPRMKPDELKKIVSDRLPEFAGMEIDPDALSFIALVSAGLPYFMHLLSQHAVCFAIDSSTSKITRGHADEAMQSAIEDSEREMKQSYYLATQSRHPRSTFHLTLAACALASRDEFGFFAAADIRDVLVAIKDPKTEISSFHTHLVRFVEKEFGGILQERGTKHQKKYRFHNPLMQPFVIIRSLADGIVSDEQIRDLRTAARTT